MVLWHGTLHYYLSSIEDLRVAAGRIRTFISQRRYGAESIIVCYTRWYVCVLKLLKTYNFCVFVSDHHCAYFTLYCLINQRNSSFLSFKNILGFLTALIAVQMLKLKFYHNKIIVYLSLTDHVRVEIFTKNQICV